MLVLQALWEGLLHSLSGSGFSAPDQVLAQLLQPSQLCRASLRDVLAYHGAQMTYAELERSSSEDLCTYVRSAVLTIQRRSVAGGRGGGGQVLTIQRRSVVMILLVLLQAPGPASGPQLAQLPALLP